MKCEVCGLSDEEVILSEGISDDKIVKICRKCSELENIPLIKKPSKEQVEASKHISSVRERMERISGFSKKKNKEQLLAGKNLDKLKAPPVKQDSKDLVNNYDWVLKVARRRSKLSLKQLSEKTGISEEDLDMLEKGQLVDNLVEKARTLEGALKVRLLNQKVREISFKAPKDEEKEILKDVEQKLNQKKKIEKIEKGEIDFSKKEDIEDIKLKDLVEMKKKKENDEMFGDDLEI